MIHDTDDLELLHAFAHALCAWALAFAAMLVRVVERRLPRWWRIEARGYVREATQALRRLVVELALARRRLCPPPRRAAPPPWWSERPESVPPGFRGSGQKSSVQRHFIRVVRVRGRSIAQRIMALRDVLLNLKAWIVRMVRRFSTVRPHARLVAVAPAACVLDAVADVAAFGADTS